MVLVHFLWFQSIFNDFSQFSMNLAMILVNFKSIQPVIVGSSPFFMVLVYF